MTPQQATIRTLVLSGKYHRYKNWQVKNRCKMSSKSLRFYTDLNTSKTFLRMRKYKRGNRIYRNRVYLKSWGNITGNHYKQNWQL